MGYPTDLVPLDYGPIPAWVGIQSRGGLCTPTPELMQLIQKFDLVFATIHGSGLNEDPGVIQRLFDNIQHMHPNVPPKLIRKYSNYRSHMRRRFLNDKLQNKKKEEARKKRDKKKSVATAKNALLSETARARNRRKAAQNAGKR